MAELGALMRPRAYGTRGDFGFSLGGTGGGALSGAAMGAEFGSVVPGIGTAVGAIVGGLAGALGGSFSSGGPVIPTKMEQLRSFLVSQGEIPPGPAGKLKLMIGLDKGDPYITQAAQQVGLNIGKQVQLNRRNLDTYYSTGTWKGGQFDAPQFAAPPPSPQQQNQQILQLLQMIILALSGGAGSIGGTTGLDIFDARRSLPSLAPSGTGVIYG